MPDERPTIPLPSPCVGDCALDPATGWCLGCGRDADDLERWRDLDDAARTVRWARLPARLEALGRTTRLLPLAGRPLLERCRTAAADPATIWSVGVPGASAEFLATPQAPATLHPSGPDLVVRSRLGAVRLRLTGGLRAFRIRRSGGVQIALCLHRARLVASPPVIRELGPHPQPLLPVPHDARLFDLGVGQRGVAFAVRTEQPDLIAALRAAAGRPLFSPGSRLPARLIQASPVRVVESPIARIEVAGRIPTLGQPTPPGPHTHLLPQRFAPEGHQENLLGLPADYVLAASLFCTETVAGRAFDDMSC